MLNSQDQTNAITFTEHGIPIRNLWHMLLYAWNEPSLGNRIAMGDIEEAPTLDALFAIVLMKLIQQRMRLGLGHGYVPATQRSRAIRGRIRFTASMMDQLAANGEVE